MKKIIRILCLVMTFAAGVPLAGCSSSPPLPPLGPEAKILAFGDSLTYGSGAGENESYPAVLGRLTGRTVINGGVPGEHSSGGARRLPELLDRERPGLLILCHGGNDLLSRLSHRPIAENLRTMIGAARERGVPVVLVAVPAPDLSLDPPHFYRDLAVEFNLPLEHKVLPKILGRGSLKSDPIHPNGAGYRLLAESLARLLEESGAIGR